MQNLDLMNPAENAWKDSEVETLVRRCFSHNFNCTPVIMERVCASGRRCFHDVHYLFKSEKGCPLPVDACPINCVVSNLVICGVGCEPCPPGVLPPRRAGNCVIFSVKYKVRVWYEFFDEDNKCLEVGQVSESYTRELAIPIEEIAGGCVLCHPESVELCIRRTKLDCVQAILVPRPSGFPKSCPPYALKVTIEKEFFAMESGRSIICVPTCVEECIELPVPSAGGCCQPFEKEPQCDVYCEETDLDSSCCAQCPPEPQTLS